MPERVGWRGRPRPRRRGESLGPCNLGIGLCGPRGPGAQVACAVSLLGPPQPAPAICVQGFSPPLQSRPLRSPSLSLAWLVVMNYVILGAVGMKASGE